MTPVSDLLRRCLEYQKDDIAWSDFWKILESAALFAVRQMLRKCGFGEDRADDLFQDLYFHLQEKSWARLKAFRGSTAGELRSFLRRVAIRFATRWVKIERKTTHRESEALKFLQPTARDGPTEQQIHNARRHLEAIMTVSERVRLHAVGGEHSPTSGFLLSPAQDKSVSTRTIRRWRHELVRQFGDRL